MSANFSVIKNKWVVITRPIHQAENIQKKLEEAGLLDDIKVVSVIVWETETGKAVYNG